MALRHLARSLPCSVRTKPLVFVIAAIGVLAAAPPAGAAWTELNGSATGGGLSNTANASRLPRVAVDSAGNPVVAWMATGSSGSYGNVYVLHWTATSWA